MARVELKITFEIAIEMLAICITSAAESRCRSLLGFGVQLYEKLTCWQVIVDTLARLLGTGE